MMLYAVSLAMLYLTASIGVKEHVAVVFEDVYTCLAKMIVYVFLYVDMNVAILAIGALLVDVIVRTVANIVSVTRDAENYAFLVLSHVLGSANIIPVENFAVSHVTDLGVISHAGKNCFAVISALVSVENHVQPTVVFVITKK